jgi:hypothetical protein
MGQFTKYSNADDEHEEVDDVQARVKYELLEESSTRQSNLESPPRKRWKGKDDSLRIGKVEDNAQIIDLMC